MSKQKFNLDKLKVHYIKCMELRTRALAVHQNIKRVSDISVNSSIITSHTGNKKRVFQEISSQIELTSRKMQTLLDRLLVGLNSLSKSSLSSNNLISHLLKFEQANKKMTDRRNIELLANVKKKLEMRIIHNIKKLNRENKSFENLLRYFEELINRLFILLTSLRIETDLLPSNLDTSSVQSLTESLEHLIDALSVSYDLFRKDYMRFKRLIKSSYNEEANLDEETNPL